jgi:hypothetical protein
MIKKIKNFICKLLGIKQCACPEDMQVKSFNDNKPKSTHCGSHTRFIKSCHQCIAITT